MPNPEESIALLDCPQCGDVVEQTLINDPKWLYACIKGHVNDGNPKHSKFYGEGSKSADKDLPSRKEIDSLRDSENHWKKTNFGSSDSE